MVDLGVEVSLPVLISGLDQSLRHSTKAITLKLHHKGHDSGIRWKHLTSKVSHPNRLDRSPASQERRLRQRQKTMGKQSTSKQIHGSNGLNKGLFQIILRNLI